MRSAAVCDPNFQFQKDTFVYLYKELYCGFLFFYRIVLVNELIASFFLSFVSHFVRNFLISQLLGLKKFRHIKYITFSFKGEHGVEFLEKTTTLVITKSL